MFELSLLNVVLLGLAVFRLTRLLVYDQITTFLRAPFSDEIEEVNENGETEIFIVPKSAGIRGWIGELIHCYWCTGVWVSIGLYFLYIFFPMIAIPIIYISAIAAIAAIIETFVQAKLY